MIIQHAFIFTLDGQQRLAVSLGPYFYYAWAAAGMFANGQVSRSLDYYCAEQTSGNYTYSSQRRLQKYLRICRDVDIYVECLLTTRSLDPLPPEVDVPLYQLDFPTEDDLKLATYMFCAKDLVKIQTLFSKDALDCEGECDLKRCRAAFVQVDKLDALEDARRKEPKDLALVRNLSCSIYGPLMNCFEKQYTDCSSKYILFRDYELATLGGSCLVKLNIHSPYVTKTICDAASYSHNADNPARTLIIVTWFISLVIFKH